MPCPSHTLCPSGSMGWRCLCRKPQGAQRSPTPRPLQRGSCWGWGTGGKWVTPAFSQAQQSVSAMRSSTWRAPRGATAGARARAGCSATSSERAPHPRPPTCHASPLVPSPLPVPCRDVLCGFLLCANISGAPRLGELSGEIATMTFFHQNRYVDCRWVPPRAQGWGHPGARGSLHHPLAALPQGRPRAAGGRLGPELRGGRDALRAQHAVS